MNGFKMYNGLLPSSPSADFEPVKHDVDRTQAEILDLVFSVDPLTGLPSSAIGKYLSDDIDPEVRDFIEKKILVDLPKEVCNYPDEVRNALKGVDPDFMVKCQRARFESLDEYHDRILNFIRKDLQTKDSKERYNELIKWYHEKFKL